MKGFRLRYWNRRWFKLDDTFGFPSLLLVTPSHHWSRNKSPPWGNVTPHWCVGLPGKCPHRALTCYSHLFLVTLSDLSPPPPCNARQQRTGPLRPNLKLVVLSKLSNNANLHHATELTQKLWTLLRLSNQFTEFTSVRTILTKRIIFWPFPLIWNVPVFQASTAPWFRAPADFTQRGGGPGLWSSWAPSLPSWKNLIKNPACHPGGLHRPKAWSTPFLHEIWRGGRSLGDVQAFDTGCQILQVFCVAETEFFDHSLSCVVRVFEFLLQKIRCTSFKNGESWAVVHWKYSSLFSLLFHPAGTNGSVSVNCKSHVQRPSSVKVNSQENKIKNSEGRIKKDFEDKGTFTSQSRSHCNE